MVVINKPVYLGFLNLEVTKIAIHGFWYGCIKSYNFHNVQFYYMDTDSFMVCKKEKDVY